MSETNPLPRAARAFVDFVGLLRVNGFAIAPEQTTTFLAAIASVNGVRSIWQPHAGFCTMMYDACMRLLDPSGP